jgi:hypothetical protein
MNVNLVYSGQAVSLGNQILYTSVRGNGCEKRFARSAADVCDVLCSNITLWQTVPTDMENCTQ